MNMTNNKLNINYLSENMNSVNNDHGYQKDYRKACQALTERCEQIENDNQKLAYRLHIIKKLKKQKSKDVTLLKNRLDIHADEWRTAGPMH
uniref:CSON005259 protein n=1 Tax=Culicoides sonorensis TaxID=179676 RepID=A0A336LJ22_CULSO